MKKQTNKKASAKSETKSEKAVSYTLDVKQNHSMRKRLQGEGVDAFALHAFEKISSAYVAFCIALYALGKAIVGESVTLFCNGVTERISYDKTTGNYSRVVGKGSLIFGSVSLLRTLYGEANVFTLTDAEISARYAANKETTKRKLGDGRTIEGRVIATGKKEKMLLEVVAVQLDGGKFALHNLEDKTNVHQRPLNRFAIVQTKATKEEKKTATATK